MSVSEKINGIKKGIYPDEAKAEIIISGFMRRSFLVKELLIAGNHLRTKIVGFSTEVSRITGIEISERDADF